MTQKAASYTADDAKKILPIETHLPNSSRLVMGCMGLGGDWNTNAPGAEHVRQAHAVVDAALEIGINFFDHADIYTLGKAESVFGQVLRERPELRDQIFLQSKCGIRFEDTAGPKRYDFSKAWILDSVDNILRRLGVDQLDSLLLHRPDPLMEGDEVAEAFAHLQHSGKVRFFGVSNMSHHQIAYLQSFLDAPLIANQVDISLKHLDWLDEGVTVNNSEGAAVNFGAGTLEYCRRQGVQLQSWGSLCQGLFSGRDVGEESQAVKATAKLVASMASERGVSCEAIVLAWLLRHPARIQAVIGSTNGARIRACGQALQVALSREDWYALYVSSRGGKLP